MILDLKKNDVSEIPNYDICIVGAGAAGITIAKKLANTKYKVALVESGDFETNSETQNLYKGYADLSKSRDSTITMVKNDSYLLSTRLRYFGGTTNHWGGWCRPFDKIDFEKRSWVPNSGWPISIADLTPYYEEAEKLTEINSFELLKEDDFQNKASNGVQIIRAPYYQYSPPTRFGEKYREDLVTAPNIDLFLNSNVTNIRLNNSKSIVDFLELKSLTGRAAKIKSKIFILACGAIENVRILLNSQDDIQDGLGNQNGLVGKYFSEHPHFYTETGFLQTWSWEFHKFEKYLGQWHEFRFRKINDVVQKRVFSISEKEQKKNRLLNLSIEPGEFAPLTDEKDKLAHSIAKISEEILDFKPSFIYKPVIAPLTIRAEQIPKKTNYVDLVNEIDILGLRKVKLRCELSTSEIENYRKSIQLFGKSLGLGTKNKARLRIDFSKKSPVSTGPHHMGTTRMAITSKEGVVDSNCKLFGTENLYISGNSVFTTGGFANPTFQTVVLSLRLAEHIIKRLQHE